MTTREKMERIAAAVMDLNSTLHPELTVGVSNPAAMAVMLDVGAPLKKSIYPDRWEVIESRETAIGGMKFKAQADSRPITGPEKAAYLRSLELHEEARRMEENLNKLREAALRTREEADRYGDEALTEVAS